MGHSDDKIGVEKITGWLSGNPSYDEETTRDQQFLETLAGGSRDFEKVHQERFNFQNLNNSGLAYFSIAILYIWPGVYVGMSLSAAFRGAVWAPTIIGVSLVLIEIIAIIIFRPLVIFLVFGASTALIGILAGSDTKRILVSAILYASIGAYGAFMVKPFAAKFERM